MQTLTKSYIVNFVLATKAGDISHAKYWFNILMEGLDNQ